MILVGLMGVIKCGDEPEAQAQTGSSKLIGDSSKAPTQIFYNVVKMG